MTELCFHCSHEQFPPSRLLDLAVRAEDAGFDGIHSADHLAPWRPDGHSGYAWAFLGAAMARTRVPFGVVTAPGQRYHPVVHAQRIATLGEMFPGRLTVALGSGQAINEHVTGESWPAKPARNARLAQCADLIRRMLAGETVESPELRVHDGRIWSRPDVPPRLFAAAITPGTAREVAAWAEGLITVGSDPRVVGEVVAAFREGGGEGKPVHLQVHVSWADDEETARTQALEQWASNALPPELAESLPTPEALVEAAAHSDPQQVLASLVVSADLDQHVARLAELLELGFERLAIHQVGPDQERFVERWGRDVLPRLRS
ncbi:LLM class F420-dependent oxidoreductase [Nocardioides gansuensis]|uniref:LLM class F420-dependent oxidoreductase n=1 Tax=Nocardioides gansuensis TaxID=2138300 RepID=A0A2T8FES6_9ACTN|nr:TIGR03885 family FMN-dependent LLM class oxidoreductase [Nocardioides gansuensis]PVG84205.1 LLM class F420-dependent oxidoreductase [Nocardioides gansuensis]